MGWAFRSEIMFQLAIRPRSVRLRWQRRPDPSARLLWADNHRRKRRGSGSCQLRAGG